MKSGNFQEFIIRNRFWIALWIVIFITIGVFIYAFLRIVSLDNSLKSVSSDLASTTVALNNTVASLSDLRLQTTGISQTLSSAQQDIASAATNLSAVQNQVGGVEQTVGNITGAVSTLQKLVTTDQELLRKYSKVYFLNENYTPAHIISIPQSYVYSNTTQEQFLQEAWPFLQKMLDAAKAAGIPLYVKSAYRSFAEQQTLKSDYTVIYGAGTANSFAADQGYSEHQLGTTADLIMSGMGGELTEAFEGTTAFQWLKLNAYKYGFEMSYPKGNAYYVYEPWHWRFVGSKLALYLHDKNMNFYDVDQRDIDTYLSNLFD